MPAIIMTARIIAAIIIAVAVSIGITFVAVTINNESLVTIGGFAGALSGFAFIMVTRKN